MKLIDCCTKFFVERKKEWATQKAILLEKNFLHFCRQNFSFGEDGRGG